MILDDETGEHINTDAEGFLEAMAVHFGKRVALATPDATLADAAALGARLGVAFMASLLEGAMDKQQPKLFMALMLNACAQREKWNLQDMTKVQFMDMTPKPGEKAN